MKKKLVTIEQVDNGYVVFLEETSDQIVHRDSIRLVENKLKRVFTHIEFFFKEDKSVLEEKTEKRVGAH